MATTTERIRIIVTQEGAIKVRKDLKDIGDEGRRSSDGINLLRTALGGITLAGIVQQLTQFADAGTELTNKLNIANEAAKGFNVTNQDLFAIANKTRQPVLELANVFQRGALAANELGASQEDLLKFTELVGKSLAVQGTSAAQARGALQQLSQALGSSVVRAEEFNSQLEGNLPLLQAVARGITEAGGSVSKLRQLVLAGQITNKEFFEGALRGAEELEAAFDKTIPTISQAFTLLNNSILELTLNSDLFRTIMGAVSRVIIFVAENLSTLAPVLALVGAGILQLASSAALPAVIALFSALNKTLLANPFVLIATALITLIQLFVQFREELGITDEQWKTFTSGLAEIMTNIGQIFGQVINYIIALFQEFYPVAKNIFDGVVSLIQSVINWLNQLIEKINAVLRLFGGSGLGGLETAVGNPNSGGNDLNRQLDGIIDNNRNLPPRVRDDPNRGPTFGINGRISPTGGVGIISGNNPVQYAGAYRTGGGYRVGGVGGEDSQDVRLRASPGERVRIETPSQVRQSQSAGTNVDLNQKIINVLDPNLMLSAMQTKKGEQVITNIMTSNAGKFSKILGAAK